MTEKFGVVPIYSVTESPAHFHIEFQLCLMSFNPTTQLWRGERRGFATRS